MYSTSCRELKLVKYLSLALGGRHRRSGKKNLTLNKAGLVRNGKEGMAQVASHFSHPVPFPTCQLHCSPNSTLKHQWPPEQYLTQFFPPLKTLLFWNFLTHLCPSAKTSQFKHHILSSLYSWT